MNSTKMDTHSRLQNAIELVRDELMDIYENSIVNSRTLDPVMLTYAKGRRIEGGDNASFECQYVEEFVTEVDTSAQRIALHRAGVESHSYHKWRSICHEFAMSQTIAGNAVSGAYELLVDRILNGSSSTSDILDSLLDRLSSETVTKSICCTYFGIEPDEPFTWEHPSCCIEIRKPTKEELERRYEQWGFSRSDLLNVEPTATIRVTANCLHNSNQPIYRSLETLTTSLLLLRGLRLRQCVQWVEYDSLVMQEKSLLRSPSPGWNMGLTGDPLPLSDQENLTSDLTAVFEKIMLVCDSSSWMRTSLEAYKDAMGVNRPSAEPISDLMRGLEALLLRTKEDEGITKALKQRTALFADLLGLDFTLVRKCVGLAYRVRSRYVHGDGIDMKTVQKLTALATPLGGIDAIARKLLLAVVMLQYRTKDHLVGDMTDSMVCLEKHKDLAIRVNTLKDSISCL